MTDSRSSVGQRSFLTSVSRPAPCCVFAEDPRRPIGLRGSCTGPGRSNSMMKEAV